MFNDTEKDSKFIRQAMQNRFFLKRGKNKGSHTLNPS